jgi:hypothetical protein
MDAVSVLVVAEDAGSRGGLVQLLSGEAGARVTGGLSPSDLVASVPTDVYAWDLGSDPVQGMRQFRQYAGVQTPTLAIVGNAVQGRAAVAAGARGTLHRDSLRDDQGAGRLVAALRACAMGFVVMDNDAGARDSDPPAAPGRAARCRRGWAHSGPLQRRQNESLKQVASVCDSRDGKRQTFQYTTRRNMRRNTRQAANYAARGPHNSSDHVTVEQAWERRRLPEPGKGDGCRRFKWAGQIFYFNSKAGRPVVKPGWAAHGPALSAEPARYCDNKATERGRLRSS